MKVGDKAIFYYPTMFTTLLEYTAHAGQVVTILRELGPEEADTEVQPMWEIQASDGWIGHAFEDELEAQSE